MKELLTILSSQTCYLRSLALVQMNLNFSLDPVAVLVDTSEYLQDLDLSGNNLRTMHFAPLLIALANNKVLNTINLSWNTIVDRND